MSSFQRCHLCLYLSWFGNIASNSVRVIFAIFHKFGIWKICDLDYRPFPHLWATLTDGGPPFFPAAWPAQLCHQGSNSLLPRQVAHRLSKCLGQPLGIFTRPLWPWNDLTFGQNILWVHICKHNFFRIFSCSQRVQKLRSKIALLLEKIIFVELDGTPPLALRQIPFSTFVSNLWVIFDKILLMAHCSILRKLGTLVKIQEIVLEGGWCGSIPIQGTMSNEPNGL